MKDGNVDDATLSKSLLVKTEESTMQMKTDAYNAFGAENKTVRRMSIIQEVL